MLCPPLRWKLLLGSCLFALLSSSAAMAQQSPGIQWRTDYNAARKEAEAKNLPVLIDFVRPNCPPCLKMEQFTFTDARIHKALNEKFVPLKINGLEDVQLASRLQINLYPTIVLASPDGRIAQTLIGFQDADALDEHLQRLLASLAPSDRLQKDFQNALAWEAAGDYARAISALKGVLEKNKSGPLHKNASELMQKIETRADESLTNAKRLLANNKHLEALESLTEMRRTFPGLRASNDAGELIGKLVQANSQLQVDQRNKRVRELLAQAREFYKSKDYIPCLDRCEIILANYADLPEGHQAYALSTEIKNNPEWLQSAADVMTDRLGGIWLTLSDSYLKRGNVRQAEFYLQRVLQAFPGSRLAESAQIRLNQLQAITPVKKDVERAGQ